MHTPDNLCTLSRFGPAFNISVGWKISYYLCLARSLIFFCDFPKYFTILHVLDYFQFIYFHYRARKVRVVVVFFKVSYAGKLKLIFNIRQPLRLLCTFRARLGRDFIFNWRLYFVYMFTLPFLPLLFMLIIWRRDNIYKLMQHRGQNIYPD